MRDVSAFVIILIFAVCGSAQTPNPSPVSEAPNDTPGRFSKVVRPPVTIPKFAISPVIDGKLNDDVWKQAAIIKDLIQTGPGDNISASRPTEIYLGYDEKFFYIAFKCWDEKDKIRASVAQRDGVFGEDNVRFWLDTYNDQRRAYVFGVNPLGIQQDGIETENQGSDFSVDVVFESKGVIEDWGWSVEVKIPFKSIRYVAGKGKSWGFNAARNIDRLNDEFDTWMPDPRGVPGFLNKFGKITGMDDIKTERTFEIIPTLTVKETGSRTSLNHFSNPPIKPDFGFTAKYSISPNVTLDMAYNPDFADTEADAPVVEANQRFPIFFSEKRPFFLEGVDIFQTSIQAVYTRRVENPDLAIKLTGKIGKNSFGIFGALDDPLFNPFGEKAYAGVFRVKRDVGKESNIGFLATSYSYPQKHNQVAGFDGRWKINKQSDFSAQVLGSTSRNFFYNPVTDFSRYQTGNGVSYNYQYNFSAKKYNYGFGGNGTSKNFRADMGFTRRNDSIQNFVYGNLHSDPQPKAFIISKNAGSSFGYRTDFSGRLQSWGYDANVNLGLKGNAEFGGGISLGQEKIYEDEFGPVRNATRPGTFYGAPSRKAFQVGIFSYFYKRFNKRIAALNANLNVNFNNFDFDFGGGDDFPRISPAAIALGQGAPLDPGKGRSLDLSFGADVKPFDKFGFFLGYNKSKLRRNDTGLLAYDANIFSYNSTYQFSRFINLKARVDYDTLSHRIFGQYTFGWTPSVGKALYLGYNDNWNHNGFVFGQQQTGFLQMNRTFFIKMSYLFRKSF